MQHVVIKPQLYDSYDLGRCSEAEFTSSVGGMPGVDKPFYRYMYMQMYSDNSGCIIDVDIHYTAWILGLMQIEN